MIIFDGISLAQERERLLSQQVAAAVDAGQPAPHIAAVVFTEDIGSQLYTTLKAEAAWRVGIGYDRADFSMTDSIDHILTVIRQFNQDPTSTGIIIQKPWRQTWVDVTGRSKTEFESWWQALVSELEPKKDVDGLHPSTLAAIRDNIWREQGRVMPATAKAVLTILSEAGVDLSSTDLKVALLGKSDLLGQPLNYFLSHQGCQVEMMGSKELRARQADGIGLQDFQVVISATGRPGLITGELLSEGVVLIDVGEPRADVDRASVREKPSFITPVPGGVGPLTVVSLLENAQQLLVHQP